MSNSVTHNRNSIVEKRFAEDDDVQVVVHSNLDERGEHCNGINGRNERSQQETLEQAERCATIEYCLAEHPDSQCDAHGVEQLVQNSQQKDRSDVIEKRPLGQEIARFQDDGRQKEEKEHITVENVDALLLLEMRQVEEQADDDAKDNQKAILGKFLRQSMRQMKY